MLHFARLIVPVYSMYIDFLTIDIEIKQGHMFIYSALKYVVTQTNVNYFRGIKHDFPFITIRKVPREVLKTEGKPEVFITSQGTLQMLMNDKLMFDRYYCIISTKPLL